MKKALKIAGITVGSILLLLILIVSIAVWFVFTPQRLTPVVQSQLDKNLLCKSQLEQVELTFFSSFPNFSLRVQGLKLLNPTKGAANDTLLSVNEVYLKVDIEKLLKENKLEIQGATLVSPNIYLFSDAQGRNNYTIVPTDSTVQDSSAFENPFLLIDLKRLDLKNAQIRYIDQTNATDITLTDLSTDIVGAIKGMNIDAALNCSIREISAQYDTIQWIVRKPLHVALSFQAGIESQQIELRKCSINSLSVQLTTNGSVIPDSASTGGYKINQEFVLSIGNLSDLQALVPPAYASTIEGVAMTGSAILTGKANGLLNEKQMPIVGGSLNIENAQIDLKEFPTYTLHNLNLKGDLLVDLNSQTTSYLKIETANAKTLNSSFEFRGKADHFFTDPRFQGEIKAQLNLTTIGKEFLQSEGYYVQGKAQTRFHLVSTLSQAQKADLTKIQLGGTVRFTEFSARSPKDSLYLQTQDTELAFATNIKQEGDHPTFFKGDFVSTDLFVQQGTTTKAELRKMKLNLLTSDIRDTTKIAQIKCTYEAEYLDAKMDTMAASLYHLKGKLAMGAAKTHANLPYYIIEAKAQSMSAHTGGDFATADLFETQFSLLDVNTEKEPMLRWIPKGSLVLNNARIMTAAVPYPITIPTINLDFRPNAYTIHSSRLIIGNSDFELSGELSDVYKYFKQTAPLKGDFTFTSKMTDLNQLMAITNGTPSEEISETKTSTPQTAEAANSSPYMVPLNIDLTLNTKIRKAHINNTDLSDINGKLYVRNGRLVMDSMSLTSPGGRMLVTSIYRTPRKNHLFAGFTLRLFDIQIKELLEMIPDIDTIMPMLRSFGGSGEFIIAAETYMDSLYNLKMSTLRAASSITGKDLVLMDGETFSEIAKMLRFNKKTVNKIDSLSAEFTVFRNEIDIYPFQIVMDKYKAVIDGKHNLDMTFNYHVSVTDCPLPIRLGMDITGSLDKPRYRLAPCKYKNMYKPSQRKEVDKKTLNLKNMIRESLNKPMTEN